MFLARRQAPYRPAKLVRTAQVNSRYDLGSTLELHCPQCKHKVLLRLSHHCRVSLTRGGQGHQQLRRKTAVWKLPSVDTEPGVLRGRRSWLEAQQATQRIMSSSPSHLNGPKRWVVPRANCVISWSCPSNIATRLTISLREMWMEPLASTSDISCRSGRLLLEASPLCLAQRDHLDHKHGRAQIWRWHCVLG